IIVDGIYGTGFHGELPNSVREITRGINKSQALVFSVDIPSGVNGDTGQADRDAVMADYTIVFHALKTAHLTTSGQRYSGEIVLRGIGIEQAK
ncbi:MAG: NAD(P)H-hydrate epimerase, partial [Anaerovoracaceae bacterium]